MATFTALNIEPDDQIDDEVDNTKELQIEEALKLYQAALKLHSQGPAAFAQAADAYTNLFKSEIFRYPETVTEFDRIEQNPELELIDPSFATDIELGAGSDGPSTLPQILYLSYKNHGQFILDCVKGRLAHSDVVGDGHLDKPSIDYQAKAALNYFTLALVSDQSDTELWRRAARVAATLGSTSAARYCLEAAVEVDDDPTLAEVDPASLEEAFAGEQLKEQLEVLGDETALSHPIMGPYMKRNMPSFLTKYIDPYPFLPDSTKVLREGLPPVDRNDGMSSRYVVTSPFRGWTAVGDVLVGTFLSPLGLSGTGVLLKVPEEHEAEPELVLDLTSEPVDAEDQIMEDAAITKSPIVDSGEAAATTPVTSKSEDIPMAAENTLTTTVPLAEERPQETSVGLPNRKRSQSAAGIRDTPEEDNATQKRSKRIRNRNDTEGSGDPAIQFAEQLNPSIRADEDVFTFIGGVLSKLGVDDLGTYPELQAALSNEDISDRTEVVENTALRDLRDILRTWDDVKASTFVNGNAADILGSSAASANAGLAAFLEQSKSGPQKTSTIPLFNEHEGLPTFISNVEAKWMPLQDIMFEWILVVLQTYRSHSWLDELKVTVVRMISFGDGDFFPRFKEEMALARGESGDPARREMLENMAQTLFELHLDIYSRITNPNSIVHHDTRIITKERLDRWSEFTAGVIRSRNCESDDELSLRFLWASVFYAAMAEHASREHKVLCWTDMKTLLEDAGKPPMESQNNAVMPEISIEAAEREVSRLTTMDFFFNLFQTDKSDPVAIIETLEPVLDPESACPPAEGTSENAETVDGTSAALREMWKFLKSGSTSLRLFLWQRLRDAYASIGYNTKVFSCHLKSIEIIVDDLRSEDYIDSADEPRRHKLLTWLKALDDLLVKSLTIALNDSAACFEIIDDRHLKSTCAALAQLNRILHTVAIFDDEVRVGMTSLPNTAAYAPQGSFNTFLYKLREMQVRTWALQYTMVKEATAQNPEVFPNKDNDLADFLALIHYCLGLRKICRVSNKIFLKMMKVEMIMLKNVDKWEDYLGQVLFDLYGIRLGVGTYLLEDHGCPIEALDRRTVMNIADQVISLANQMPIKDLIKHELKSTIEKMQTAVGAAKHSPNMQHNLRNYTERLRCSIRPLDMYKSLKGQIEVDSLPVTTAESPLASRGWYFLLGMISLTKFKAQKRLSPGSATEDMKVAASFMRLQLQFNADDWETWFRLAQCFDAELEEEVMWSADKINNHRAELVKLQRGAIHSYMLALSAAVRSADDSTATAAKLSDLYHEFGMRLYASSREPFGMEAFWVDGFEKHMSGAAGMYKRPLHDEMTRYRTWKFASTLFRKAIVHKPFYWMNHYMLGKCLWKMYRKADDEYDPAVRATKPSVEAVLNAFVQAVKTVPKPRDGRQEPILEPHYKIVSVVHKLVLMGALPPQQGADLLQGQPYAINKGEPATVLDFADWEGFVLASMKQLRIADKQHWQHRMVARVAGILYDEEQPDYAQASAARHEFRETIFTKTMHIQVWKPDAERAGRHCVYMERYVRYICKVLVILNDKFNMEQLAKRVRKKQADFFQFHTVWSEVCTSYLRLIRKKGGVEPNMDEIFKSIPPEEFEAVSIRLADWCANPNLEHPAAEALRDTLELKKLNVGSAMKSTPIDDLINDCYAVIYMQIAKDLPAPDLTSLANAQLDGEARAIPPRAMNPMGLNNLVMDMGNGTHIPVPVTIAGSEPSRPRKIGISRREISKRAEEAVAKMPEASKAPPSASTKRQGSDNEPSMVLGSNAGLDLQPSATVTPDNRNDDSGVQESTENGQGDEQDNDEPEQDEEQDDEAGNEDESHEEQLAENSHPAKEASPSESGSIHDSADDESDLSDVPEMEDIDEARIFPDLVRHNHDDDHDEGDDGSEEEEEEEEEGQEEGVEDEDEEAEEEEEGEGDEERPEMDLGE